METCTTEINHYGRDKQIFNTFIIIVWLQLTTVLHVWNLSGIDRKEFNAMGATNGTIELATLVCFKIRVF